MAEKGVREAKKGKRRFNGCENTGFSMRIYDNIQKRIGTETYMKFDMLEKSSL